MDDFEKQVLEPRYAHLVEQYQAANAKYKDVKTPAPERAELEKKLPEFLNQIQNWDSIKDQALNDKRHELFGPLYSQVSEAIRAVAKEKGYTHVFEAEAFLVAPEGDNLLPAVAAKFGVQLPAPK